MAGVFNAMFKSPRMEEQKPEMEKRRSASTAASTASSTLSLPKTLVKNMPKVYDEKLIPLDLRFGVVRKEDYSLTLRASHRKVLREAQFYGKAKASVCFVVRRPGCLLCHEQGMALTNMLSEFSNDQVAAFAVVKEVDVDNDGLLSLYQDYFKFPFFLDSKQRLYKALGDRRASIMTTLLKFNKFRHRLASKNIEGNMIGQGEGIVLGGTIIFDAQGEIRFAHLETIGDELPVSEVRAALEKLLLE